LNTMNAPARVEALPPPIAYLAPALVPMFYNPGSVAGAVAFALSRYKCAHGGRGSAKSWGIAGMATVLGATKPIRFLCVREVQTSMRQSIHKLLSNRIEELGLSRYYDVQAESIIGKYKTRVQAKYKRTEMVFAGIKSDPAKIKGFEEPDVCLGEEGENYSLESWKQLRPTIRNGIGNSEIWISFNPRRREDPTSKIFIEKPSRHARVVTMNWDDNPWFPADLEIERQEALDDIRNARDDDERAQAQADYDHVWGGLYERKAKAGVIKRWAADEVFSDPPAVRPRYGVDWGFANDPTAMVRFYITPCVGRTGEELWISHEAFGYGVELDDLPALFKGDSAKGWEGVPGCERWPIKADCAAPGTISHVKNKGFNITGAEKWAGSVEDGIRHLNQYRVIHIHARCRRMKDEARMYQFKVDRVTGEILPDIVDAHNHGWDAVRYGCDGLIKHKRSSFG
jgi:phage terminase large subunit